jgi:hypothetical protein
MQSASNNLKYTICRSNNDELLSGKLVMNNQLQEIENSIPFHISEDLFQIPSCKVDASNKKFINSSS